MSLPERRAAIRKTLIDLAIMTALGVVLAVVGPFGSFGLPFAWRLVYWVAVGWGGYACYRPIAGLVVRLGRALELPEALNWISAALIATVPMSAIVYLVGHLGRPLRMPTLEEALTNYGYVLVIGGMVTALFYLLDHHKDDAAPTVAEPARPAPLPAPPVRFFDRIPLRLGTNLVALEMEDHYLRIHTRLGSDLILMRMGDAVAELDGLDGARVHRSWWVARGAVEGVEREGRNLRLLLEGGLKAPVARESAATLKAAGWFA